ncbi:hypothetical protein M758_3G112200 [Ceratodon purpureus]|nr:hypothetical protein M758_3G112200 [Ceratodon purpureus]
MPVCLFPAPELFNFCTVERGLVVAMAAILGRASCLQFGSKFENVHWKPQFPTWRAMHTSCLPSDRRASAALLDEVPGEGGNDDSEVWEPPQIERLYEDDYIIGVTKPGTLLVHNNKGALLIEKQRKAFLKNMVEAQLTAGQRVSPVHRLDRPASGAMILAKSGDAARAAQASLAHPACIKEYIVLARGSTPDLFICDEPVNDDKGRPKTAITQCEKVLDLPEARCTLLKVIIKTGRWHQIRKHLNHRAHHVIGDVQHGKGRDNRYFRENYKMRSGRIFLHAARLTFPHPLHLSRDPTSKYPNESIDNLEFYSSDSEDLESDVAAGLDSKQANPSIWMGPNTTLSEDPKTRHQLITIRASLPQDLQDVLYAIPDGLDPQKLLSLGLIFQ